MADLNATILQLSPFSSPGNGAALTQALSASTTKVGMVYSMPEAATLTTVGFLISAVTGTPPTYKIGLQGVTSAGVPNGTYLGGGSPASMTTATFATGWKEVTLDNSYAAARGDRIAVVVEYSSGTVDASNCITIQYRETGFNGWSGPPWPLVNTGSWSANTISWPFFSVKSASKTYGFPASVIATAITEANAGRRLAQKFTIPDGVSESFKVVGLRFGGRLGSSNADVICGIWDSSSALQTIQSDYPGNAATWLTVMFDEVTLATLEPGTVYYAGIEHVSGTFAEVLGIELPAAGDMTAFPLGTDCHFATYNGSAWSDVTTKRLWIDLIVADITEPTGGGATPYVIGS